MELPEGITEVYGGTRLWDRHASPLSILLLTSILGWAMAGQAGGQPAPITTRNFSDAQLSVKLPAILRNGEFFESRIEVTATTSLSDVQLAISPELWRDITINTMIPAASQESFERGEYRFSYGRLAAGETLAIKIDGQINPPLVAGTVGDVAVFDGRRLIGRHKFNIRVLP